MITLIESLHAWESPTFSDVFKREVDQLDGKLLPLQQGLSQGSVANEDVFNVVVLSVSEQPDFIRVKAGIFYSSVIAGCACADDPTPENKLPEYCEVLFEISRDTADTRITLC